MEATQQVLAWGNIANAAEAWDCRQPLKCAPNDLQLISSCGHGESAAMMFFNQLTAYYRNTVLPQTWERMKGMRDAPQVDCDVLEQQLLTGLEGICSSIEPHCKQMQLLTDTIMDATPMMTLANTLLQLQTRFRETITALLTITCPINLSEILQHYYSGKLAALASAMRARCDEDDDDVENMMDVDDINVADVMGATWVQRLIDITRGLDMLGLEAICEGAWTAVLRTYVHAHLRGHAHRTFTRRVLGPAQQQLAMAPLTFVKLLLPPWTGKALPWGQHPQPFQLERGKSWRAAVAEWRSWLTYFVYETLGEMRMGEMFDIVVEYPDSMPALDDIADCLRHTNLHAKFVQGFRSSIKQRLLQPGASTNDIIHQYILMIKALRSVEPTGMLLEAFGIPIREYLRHRPDTIKCLVSMLTDDSDGAPSLLAELQSSMEGAADSDEDADDDDAVIRSAEQWQPPPAEVDALPSTTQPSPQHALMSSSSRHHHDVISMLLQIYSDTQFMEQYKKMLGEKLLVKGDFRIDNEIRAVELFKLRFGESKLHYCEVMLKDVADSKRMQHAKVLHCEPTAAVPQFTSLVMSYLFWPDYKDKEHDLNLPEEVRDMMEQCAASYHKAKAPRKLRWKPSLGVVDLTLTVGDETRDFQVPPAQAIVLQQFKHCNQWTAADLADAVGLSVDVLRRKAMLWVHHGVLCETMMADGSSVYRRCDAMPQLAAGAGTLGELLEDDAATMAGAANNAAVQLQQEMGKYENYIISIITNMSQFPMTLARLHSLLGRFVVSPRYDKTQDQLSAFMDILIIKKKVKLENGQYKVIK